MIDLSDDFGQRVKLRLTEEEVIWLTTVTPRGVPQPNPVWFYWDGEAVIIYSQPGAYRIRNIRHNPLVGLHLQGADVLGNNAVIMLGEASLEFSYPQIHAGYVGKYAKYLPVLRLTLDQLVKDYSVEIKIIPTRLRGE